MIWVKQRLAKLMSRDGFINSDLPGWYIAEMIESGEKYI